jgi:hypothetical protein
MSKKETFFISVNPAQLQLMCNQNIISKEQIVEELAGIKLEDVKKIAANQESSATELTDIKLEDMNNIATENNLQSSSATEEKLQHSEIVSETSNSLANLHINTTAWKTRWTKEDEQLLIKLVEEQNKPLDTVDWTEINKRFSGRTSGAAKFKYERMFPRGLAKAAAKNDTTKKDSSASHVIRLKRQKETDSSTIYSVNQTHLDDSNTKRIKFEQKTLPSPVEQCKKINAILEDKCIYVTDIEKAQAISNYILNSCTFINCLVNVKIGKENFIGKVVGYIGSNYTVVFDDGEIMHLNEDEVKRYLC